MFQDLRKFTLIIRGRFKKTKFHIPWHFQRLSINRLGGFSWWLAEPFYRDRHSWATHAPQSHEPLQYDCSDFAKRGYKYTWKPRLWGRAWASGSVSPSPKPISKSGQARAGLGHFGPGLAGLGLSSPAWHNTTYRMSNLIFNGLLVFPTKSNGIILGIHSLVRTHHYFFEQLLTALWIKVHGYYTCRLDCSSFAPTHPWVRPGAFKYTRR